MDAKKLKLIVKGERKPTFGTDPNEPWSVRAGITESERGELHAYLKSRGINPEFVSKDTKISHAKSSEFHKWKRDHQFDDPINYVSTTVADRMKKQRAQTEEIEIEEGKTLQHTPVELRQHAIDKEKHMTKVLHHNGLHKEESEQIDELAPETLASYVLKTTSKDPKRAEPRKKAMSKLAKIMAKRSFSEEKKPTALEKFRAAAAEREKKHDEIQKKQSKDGSGMTAAIDRLEKHLNKEEAEQIDEVSSSEVEHHFNNWTNSEHAPYNSDAGDDNKVHQSALSYLRSTNVPKEKHEKLAMHIAHKFHGSGIDEEVEQIDELKKSTVFSWLKQQPVVPEKKPGMTRKDHNKKIKSHSKSWNRALDRLAGYKPTSEETEDVSEVFSTGVQGHVSQAALDSIKNKRNVKVNLGTPSYNPKPKTLAKNPSKKASFISRLLNKEDTYQDSYAATQTTGMEIVDLPADEKYNKRKEMSKSARMIKSLYKKKGMKEGVDGQSGGGIMYDKEKTDKLETPYGKKPSMVRADKKLTISDKEPQAAAVLTGGKTLTGQDRDTLEIDPLMRKPGPPLDQNKKT